MNTKKWYTLQSLQGLQKCIKWYQQKPVNFSGGGRIVIYSLYFLLFQQKIQQKQQIWQNHLFTLL